MVRACHVDPLVHYQHRGKSWGFTACHGTLISKSGGFCRSSAAVLWARTGKKFRDLLTEHLKIAGNLVNAAKSGDAATVNQEREKWYANADEIAAFLAGINPYWSKDQWTSMLHKHLKLTEEEAVARLMGQYAKDVALYDVIEDQALMMGDYMAEGIIRQFLR